MLVKKRPISAVKMGKESSDSLVSKKRKKFFRVREMRYCEYFDLFYWIGRAHGHVLIAS